MGLNRLKFLQDYGSKPVNLNRRDPCNGGFVYMWMSGFPNRELQIYKPAFRNQLSMKPDLKLIKFVGTLLELS